MSNWLYQMEEVQRLLREARIPYGCPRFQMDTVYEAEKVLNDLIQQYMGHEDAKAKLLKDKKIAKLQEMLDKAVAAFKDIQAEIDTPPAVPPPPMEMSDNKFYGKGVVGDTTDSVKVNDKGFRTNHD